MTFPQLSPIERQSDDENFETAIKKVPHWRVKLTDLKLGTPTGQLNDRPTNQSFNPPGREPGNTSRPSRPLTLPPRAELWKLLCDTWARGTLHAPRWLHRTHLAASSSRPRPTHRRSRPCAPVEYDPNHASNNNENRIRRSETPLSKNNLMRIL